MTAKQDVDPRCREIRERLPGFLADSLGDVATGEVQGHLLTCEACSHVYGDLIMQDVERGSEPLLTPPCIPPQEWYSAYLRARSGRAGLLWASVRDAAQSADARARAWAREQRERVAGALAALLMPPLAAVPVRGAVQTRGSVRPRGGRALIVEVLSPAWEATGETVSFRVVEPAHVTNGGRFRLRLETETPGHDGHLVVCTIRLPEMPPVSFTGNLTKEIEAERWEVQMNEAGVSRAAGSIPATHVTVELVKN